jgi:hypothetical protein
MAVILFLRPLPPLPFPLSISSPYLRFLFYFIILYIYITKELLHMYFYSFLTTDQPVPEVLICRIEQPALKTEKRGGIFRQVVLSSTDAISLDSLSANGFGLSTTRSYLSRHETIALPLKNAHVARVCSCNG